MQTLKKTTENRISALKEWADGIYTINNRLIYGERISAMPLMSAHVLTWLLEQEKKGVKHQNGPYNPKLALIY